VRYVRTACLLHPLPPITNRDVGFTQTIKCSVNIARVFRNGMRQRTVVWAWRIICSSWC